MRASRRVVPRVVAVGGRLCRGRFAQSLLKSSDRLDLASRQLITILVEVITKGGVIIEVIRK